MGSGVVAIIPARFGSTRFPGKPLADIDGKPMIRHVYERAVGVPSVDRVLVATDDRRIAEVVRSFGGEVVLTRSDHPSGSDRVAEVAAGLSEDIVLNIQGDVPLLDPGMAEAAIAALEVPDAAIGTVRAPLRDRQEAENPNVVKVVCDLAGYALYFSRAPIPAWRDGGRPDVPWFRHIGIYAYRRPALLELAALPPTSLERAEKLEQLRALEHGWRIRVADCEVESVEVDTPGDLERVRRIVEARRGERAGQ